MIAGFDLGLGQSHQKCGPKVKKVSKMWNIHLNSQAYLHQIVTELSKFRSLCSVYNINLALTLALCIIDLSKPFGIFLNNSNIIHSYISLI